MLNEYSVNKTFESIDNNKIKVGKFTNNLHQDFWILLESENQNCNFKYKQQLSMNEQSKIREQLDRKIKQRMVTNDHNNLDIQEYSNNLLSELQSLKESFHSERLPSKVIERDQLEQELKKQRQVQHKLQLNIDRLRIKLLEVNKEEDHVRESITQKRKEVAAERERLEAEHSKQIQKIESENQQRLHQKIQEESRLIEQKQEQIKLNEELTKKIKEKTERLKKEQKKYQNQIEEKKKVYETLEREKFKKYQHSRIQQLKEKAIKDTEPKLLAIIESSNKDIKKAEQTNRNGLQTFKVQYKIKLEKDLTNAKQKIFQDGEKQKQKLFADYERKQKARYQQKEVELQQQVQRIKESCREQIKIEEHKMRAEMEEFIMRNKDSHNSNVQEIKQLKTNYEEKLKKMNENLHQLKLNKLKEYEEKYRILHQEQIKQIDQTSEEKFQAASEKIRKDLAEKIDKIKRQVQREKTLFTDEIVAKYQKMLLTEKNKLEEILQEEKRKYEKIESNLINLQKNKAKEEAKTRQMQKERENLENKKEELERRISNHNAELQAYERLKLQKEKQTKKKAETMNAQKQQQFQKLKATYLAKQEEKQARLKQLLDEYQHTSNTLAEELAEYRGEIESNIGKRKGELMKLMEQNARLQRENQMMQKEIEEQSRRLRS